MATLDCSAPAGAGSSWTGRGPRPRLPRIPAEATELAAEAGSSKTTRRVTRALFCWRSTENMLWKNNTHSFSMLKCYQHIIGIRTHHVYHTKCTFWTFEHFVQGHGVYFLVEWNVKTVTLYGYFLNCIVCTLNDPDLTQGDTNPHKEICIVGH